MLLQTPTSSSLAASPGNGNSVNTVACMHVHRRLQHRRNSITRRRRSQACFFSVAGSSSNGKGINPIPSASASASAAPAQWSNLSSMVFQGPVNRSIGMNLRKLNLNGVVSLLGLLLVTGVVVIQRAWNRRRRKEEEERARAQLPTSLSVLLQKKESVEWVNMVIGKLWKVYQAGLENWLVGLLQPIIDNLKKPAYVRRVQIKQFSLGKEPISVRSVERRTSRRANDLQYNIGLRYTGGARMLLMLSVQFGFIPMMIPVGVRDLDVDGELWVKLQLIPSVPWVGTATWAFVSLPKIKLNLAPFRLFNLMAIPVLSMFLTKLLTEDLPRLFVRPNKIVLNFEKGQATGPMASFRAGGGQEGNKDFVGELSVLLVDARNLNYIPFGKTDPYVVLVLGDQVARSKKNSKTTVIGPPGFPIWNQDFQFLVGDPQKQKLVVNIKDSFGVGTYTVGTGEVEIGSLQDTVPGDRIVTLKSSWGLLQRTFSGEVFLRLTYKAYVEDEEDDMASDEKLGSDNINDEMLRSKNDVANVYSDQSDSVEEESFMDTFVALLASEEFQGIVSFDPDSMHNFDYDNEKSSLYSKAASSSTSTQSIKNADQKRGFVIFWFALLTAVSVLVAISLDGSNFFNP